MRFPGGGHKVNMLRPVVEKWRDEKNMVVMFVDRYVPTSLRDMECVCVF